jgi:DNA polymerase III epsilon subunit family exonuclease
LDAAGPRFVLSAAAERLGSLRASGRPIPLAELAAGLVASPDPVPPALARRVVAAALGRPAASLPDPLPAEALPRRPAATDRETALGDACFAVVDLETTGPSPRRAAILEIGAVRVRGLSLEERFETLVDPGSPVPPRITALTGITTAMLRGAPRAGRALGDLQVWLDATPGAPFVAHNAPFDAGFVRRGLAHHGLGPLERPVLCTRRLARRLAPELGRYGLEQLTSAFGIRNAARHRALGDAVATAEALCVLMERAGERYGVRDLGGLLDLHATPPRRLRAAQP